MITHARFYILFSLGCDDFLWINSSAKKTQNGSRQTYTAAIQVNMFISEIGEYLNIRKREKASYQ
jgi:hypothetical protein